MPNRKEIEAAERTDTLADLMARPGLWRCERRTRARDLPGEQCGDCGHPMLAHPDVALSKPHAACTQCTADALWTALVPLLAALQGQPEVEQTEASLVVLDWRQGVLCDGSGDALLCPVCDGAILTFHRMTVGSGLRMRHAPCPDRTPSRPRRTT
jgi:hypothetical protein